MIKILFIPFYEDENIFYFNEDYGNVVFTCNGLDIIKIDLNNVNLDNTYYDEDDPDTIIFVRLLAWHINFEKRKAQELMEIAWHPKRCRNFACQKVYTQFEGIGTFSHLI